MHRVTFKIEKQPPTTTASNQSDNLELFHGIGNTLGFDLTGGVDFSMPITIFHVKEGSRADNAGLKLGDSILSINNVDTSNMTLQEANNVLEQASQQDVKLGVIKFDEVDESNPEKKPTIHEILLKGSLSIELTVKSMQRQLLQIADRIPDDILLTLLKCFAQLLAIEPEQTTKSTGPFIRAFAKIRDDGSERQFSAILEEDEDQIRDEKEKIIEPAVEAFDEGDNECTFNYKITNVVTQEVLYSVGNQEDNGNVAENESDEQEQQELLPQTNDQEIIESLPNASEENYVVDDDNCNNSRNENDESVNEMINSEEMKQQESQNDENGSDIEEIHDDISNGNNDDQTSECNENKIDDESTESEKPQIDEGETVQPLEKVSLDDIQREIQEMQKFLFNKGVTAENKSQNEQNNINQELIKEKAKAKVEDAYNVDVCINLKKKGGERKQHTRSKAILSSYINETSHGKPTRGDKERNRNRIFDPSVPNTPEDFLKEKSVSEKINKKKQKIKHLDMSWQKLCDDQQKVYKHSNFKTPNAERA